jgi:hypothetical protein
MRTISSEAVSIELPFGRHDDVLSASQEQASIEMLRAYIMLHRRRVVHADLSMQAVEQLT